MCVSQPIRLTLCHLLQKDTWANIEATGEFTVNIISEWFIEAANWTSGLYPPETSEWAESGLTPLPSVKVRPPRVAESAFQMVRQPWTRPMAAFLVPGKRSSEEIRNKLPRMAGFQSLSVRCLALQFSSA